jgi:hypothetical protein
LKPDPALERRYEAALPLLAECCTVEERLDLLAAVCWPEAERLWVAA